MLPCQVETNTKAVSYYYTFQFFLKNVQLFRACRGHLEISWWTAGGPRPPVWEPLLLQSLEANLARANPKLCSPSG